MYNGKKFLAIIPARSGSKGVVDKNIRLLAGKPLIAHTIQQAIDTGVFDEIHVSTDSQKYLDIAKEWGASDTFVRPEDLAEDTSSTWDVVEYVIKKYYSRKIVFDYVVVLQPTSPLRYPEDILNTINLAFTKEKGVAVSVCEVDHSPLWTSRINDENELYDLENSVDLIPRQQLEKYYRLNGAIYVTDVENFLDNRNAKRHLYSDGCYAYVMPQQRSIDIDSDMDFLIAESYFNVRTEDV